MYGKLWLVEEHVTEGPYGGPEKIQWRKIVTATGVDPAFEAAEEAHREDLNHGFCSQMTADGGYSFAFGVDDLDVLEEDYLWGASDGSSIWYEIRYLGALEVNMNWGSQNFGLARLAKDTIK